MGLREKLNERPKAGAALGIALFVVSVGLVIWMMTDTRRDAAAEVQNLEWFSADDGQTWFADDISKTAPFKTADGRTAVKAVVYKCAHGKTFVAYLERTNPDTQRKTSQSKRDSGNPYADYFSVSQAGIQVKKPGAAQWVQIADPAAARITTPVCPEGSTDQLQLVTP